MGVSHKWREIGLSLVLTPDAVDAIDEHSDNNEQKLIDVILLWEESKTRPFSWDSLLIVLNSTMVDERPLAEQIKRWVIHYN